MCFINMIAQLLWERFVIHSHFVATVGIGPSGHGHSRQRSPRIVAFLGQAGNDAHGGIVLVKGIGQLIAGL